MMFRPLLFTVVFVILLWAGYAAAATGNGTDIFRPVSGTPEYQLQAESPAGSATDVFGSRRGYVHPFLSLGGYYTSNLFNAPDDEKSDLVMVVSPGIWVALPASRQQLIEVETMNTAPGGLDVSRFSIDTERRFQAYGLYRGEFYKARDYDEADTDDHRAEAFLVYRFRGGLALELLNVFENDHDDFSTGDAAETRLETFRANLFNPVISYQVSPKTRLQLDYSWYVLDYDSANRSFRDREDHAVSAYVFYKFAAKTSAFLDYEYINVDYDEETSPDNYENRFFGGLQWRVTDRSIGRFKLGYGKKEFEGSSVDDRDFVAIEAQWNHRLTRKTKLFLHAVRRAGETDVESTRDLLTHRFRVGVTHLVTPKLTGKLVAAYYNDDYKGTTTVGGETGEREDDKYRAEFALGFTPRRWLNFSTGYVYSERDSNFDSRDYTDHTVYLHATAAL